MLAAKVFCRGENHGAVDIVAADVATVACVAADVATVTATVVHGVVDTVAADVATVACVAVVAVLAAFAPVRSCCCHCYCSSCC